jgi:hypothetical protein
MPSAKDFIKDDELNPENLNFIKNNYAGTVEPTDPVAGLRWFNTSTLNLKIYNGSSFVFVGSIANPFPVGTILPWNPGYYTNGSNAGFTLVLGATNDAAGANGYLNLLGWYVCNGATLINAESPIWNSSGRYLPNLTDDRFIMGDTAIAWGGGETSNSHVHSCDPPSTVSGGASSSVSAQINAAGTYRTDNTHTHDCDLPAFNSAVPKVGAAGLSSENRPLYLALFYIIRVW